jgi:hypothetical protein
VAASAYTVGSHVVFDSGQYTPQTTFGQKLLAHELAHVVQQGNGEASSIISSPLRIGNASDEAERQAHAAEDMIGPVKQPLLPGSVSEPRQLSTTGFVRRRVAKPASGGLVIPGQEPVGAAEQKFFKRYVSDCAGITLTVRRPADEPAPEQLRRLLRRLKGLPRVVKAREAIVDELADNPYSSQPLKHLREFDENQVDPEFGKGYQLGSLEEELSKVHCEMSELRWKLAAKGQDPNIQPAPDPRLGKS